MSNHAAPEGKQVDDETIQALFSAPCDTDFAYLKPVNDPAIEAFSEAVNHAGKDKDTYEHTIQFMRLFKKPPPRASSVCSIEDDAIDKPEDLPQRPAQWHGYYALNFDMSPMLLYAWVAGTEMGIKEHGGHDLLLAPPTQKWHQKGVRGTHFKLYFAQGSGQMLIEIRHRLKLNGNPYHKEKVLEAPVLHSGTRIDIGDCSYVFAFDERTKKDPFRQEFNRFMRISVQDSLTAPHAPSTAGNMDLGRYSCPVSHFKSGASGQVGPGWTQSDGSRVLIKRFKRYDDPALKSYKRMFDKVRGHTNIIPLIETFRNLEVYHAGVFQIYGPIRFGSLYDHAGSYSFDQPAQVGLLRDWVCGLAYMHEKGLMHRAITPSNLGITSAKNPRGFILGLDVATENERSSEVVGTVQFLAPEIIKLQGLSRRTKPTPDMLYDKSIDMWALGISALAMKYGVVVTWSTLDTPEESVAYERGGTHADQVTMSRWKHLDHFLKAEERKASQLTEGKFLVICHQTLAWDVSERSTAQRALRDLEALAQDTVPLGPGRLESR